MFEPFFDALGVGAELLLHADPQLRAWRSWCLTVLVMVLITPLTVKSTRSMLQMQRLQPEMKRIQEKYKNDREKLNAELMAFYQENKINPLGGCLPLLAQMPVFIIMYQLMRGLTVRPGGLGTGTGPHRRPDRRWASRSRRGSSPTSSSSPSHLNPGTELYQALSTTNDMNFLGMDLSACRPARPCKASVADRTPLPRPAGHHVGDRPRSRTVSSRPATPRAA